MNKFICCALYMLVVTNIIYCNNASNSSSYPHSITLKEEIEHSYRLAQNLEERLAQKPDGKGNLPTRESCPNAEDISPCSCTSGQNGIELDCSSVEDDEDLARVFRASFPQTNIHKLTIAHNNHITNLSDGIFGDIKFEDVHINFCEVQFVGINTFLNSAETLRKLNLQANLLSEFPFHILDEFRVLTSVIMNVNKFTSVPILNVPKLNYFAMHTNPLKEVPENPFRHLPNLETVYLSKANIPILPRELFTLQSNLTLVDFSLNQLTSLSENTFALVSDKMDWLYLMDNSISSIQPGAFSGMRDMLIDFQRNSLELLEESVFGEILHNNVVIRLQHNPLVCGCDVAWIVKNTDLHHVVDTARCADGQRLVDLDPSDFDNCP